MCGRTRPLRYEEFGYATTWRKQNLERKTDGCADEPAQSKSCRREALRFFVEMRQEWNQILRGMQSRARPGGNQGSSAIDSGSADTTATNGRIKATINATNCRMWVSTHTIQMLQRQKVTWHSMSSLDIGNWSRLSSCISGVNTATNSKNSNTTR